LKWRGGGRTANHLNDDRLGKGISYVPKLLICSGVGEEEPFAVPHAQATHDAASADAGVHDGNVVRKLRLKHAVKVLATADANLEDREVSRRAWWRIDAPPNRGLCSWVVVLRHCKKSSMWCGASSEGGGGLSPGSRHWSGGRRPRSHCCSQTGRESPLYDAPTSAKTHCFPFHRLHVKCSGPPPSS